jgi:hypothetical protein
MIFILVVFIVLWKTGLIIGFFAPYHWAYRRPEVRPRKRGDRSRESSRVVGLKPPGKKSSLGDVKIHGDLRVLGGVGMLERTEFCPEIPLRAKQRIDC